MLDKAMLDKMLAMPDERLLAMLRLVLAGAGVDLGGKMPDAKTVKKIRALLCKVTQNDLDRVEYLADCYKNGG